MIRNHTLLFTGIIAFFMHSCFEEDERVMPYPGQVNTIMDSIQTHTSYFDLESGKVIATHSNHAWQLGFECGAEGWRIITNSGANWFIYNTGQPEQNMVINMPANTEGLYDIQHAYPDSTAVGEWVSFTGSDSVYPGNIYLLGRRTGGTYSQLKQITFLELTDSSYRFAFREEYTGLTDTVIVYKADTVNFAYYSFTTHGQVYPEPNNTRYDLIFTSYYDRATLFGITIPYLVGGVLQNTGQTTAALDSLTGYAGVDVSMITGYAFTSQRDIPGYRWKGVTVDLAAGGTASYAVKSNYTYIIHTAEKNYYKLRFISYSLDGRSGFPQFEYAWLK